jgi:hypothetical protein
MRMRMAHDHASAAEQMDVLVARARISVLAAHTHAARQLVEQLRHRYPAGVVLSTYCRRMGLSANDTEYIALQTRARLSLPHAPGTLLPSRTGPRPPRGEPGSVARGMAWLRDQAAPLSTPAEREQVRTQLAHATTSIMAVYVRYAQRFAALAGDQLSLSAAIALFLDRVDADPDVRTAVHALALSRLAGHAGELPAGDTAVQLVEAMPMAGAQSGRIRDTRREPRAVRGTGDGDRATHVAHASGHGIA